MPRTVVPTQQIKDGSIKLEDLNAEILSSLSGGIKYTQDTSETANSIIVNPLPAFASYDAGMALIVKVAIANTGTMTIDVNSLGSKNIKRSLPSGLVDLVSGSIAAGGIIILIYDGTQFQMIGGPTVWT